MCVLSSNCIPGPRIGQKGALGAPEMELWATVHPTWVFGIKFWALQNHEVSFNSHFACVHDFSEEYTIGPRIV